MSSNYLFETCLVSRLLKLSFDWGKVV